MRYLTAEEILALDDRRFVEVEVPEWGTIVRVGTMTAAARDRFELQYLAARNGKGDEMGIRAALVAACAVKEDGTPFFTADQVVDLAKKNGNAVSRLFNVASELNVLTPAASARQTEDL